MLRRSFCLAPIIVPVLGCAAPGTCLTTLPPNPPFQPPAPYDGLSGDGYWYGTNELWTLLPFDGIWHMQGNVDKDGGYVTKLTFWRKGFNAIKEPRPNLIVTAKRLDEDSGSVAVASASAVFLTGKTPAMMTRMRIPAPGCWQITGHYGTHVLTFIVAVQP
jgi:hypothetical protein